jgi:hypothetical protein
VKYEYVGKRIGDKLKLFKDISNRCQIVCKYKVSEGEIQAKKSPFIQRSVFKNIINKTMNEISSLKSISDNTEELTIRYNTLNSFLLQLS